MAQITTENIFVSGTVARASKVNENFDSITSGLYDGTKDLNMANITVGTLTATSGTVTTLDVTNLTAQNFTSESPTLQVDWLRAASGVLSSGQLISSNGVHETTFGVEGLSGVIRVDGDIAAKFKSDGSMYATNYNGKTQVLTDTSDYGAYNEVQTRGETTTTSRLYADGVGSYANHSFTIKTNNTDRHMFSSDGKVGIGITNASLIGAELHVSGYTKLGYDAPAIKTLLITGTLPASGESQNYSIAPITSTHNIIGVNILASGDYAYQASTWNPPFRAAATVNYEYTLLSQPDFGVQVLQIRMGANCDTIENNPFKAFITYVA